MPKKTAPGAAPSMHISMKRYDRFAGVDFSIDPSQVADFRSPYAQNLLSDIGGYPEKRLGWRTLCRLNARINGIFRYRFGGVDCLIVHSGTALYQWDGTTNAPKELKNGINDAKSSAMMFKDKLLILTGKEYLYFDGTAVKTALEAAYVPTITTGITHHDVKLGGGVTYQPVNMLTPLRKIGFCLSEQSQYLFLGTSIDNITNRYEDIKILVNGEPLENSYWVVNYDTGMIQTTGYFPATSTPGIDNITVEFSHTVDGYAERINDCSIMTSYNNRIFVSGNPKYPNTDWYSELNDPFYITDLGYKQFGAKADKKDDNDIGSNIGSGGSRIMGYAHIGEQLAVLKEDNDQDATIFMRSAELTENGTIFPVKQGIAGVGAYAPKAIATLMDDPLFLSRNGVYGIASQAITAERVMQQRSTRVNARLTREPNLQDAVACIWNGYYVLCINGNVYLADSRQRTYARNESGTFEYEWYFWTHVPAVVILDYDDTLFFGTENGRLCRFNTDKRITKTDNKDTMDEVDRGYAMDAYNDDGEAIVAQWSTKMDDDGDFCVLKTLQKKGSGVYLKSYERSNVELIIKTDYNFGETVNKVRRGIFNFKDIDFNNFTFNTLPNGFIPFGCKVKKYRTIQVICRNSEPNQGFGVYAIERRFTTGYFAK